MAVCHQYARHQFFLAIGLRGIANHPLFIGELLIEKKGVVPFELGFDVVRFHGLCLIDGEERLFYAEDEISDLAPNSNPCGVSRFSRLTGCYHNLLRMRAEE